MHRENLKIGQTVLVIPETNKYPPKELYVRELHDSYCAGLSHTMETPPEKSYGIYYRVIHPINKFKLWRWHLING